MWNRCVSLVPASLVSPISAPRHDRIVRELQIPTSSSSGSCSWLCARSSSCTPQMFCCPSSSCCSVSNHRSCLFPPSCRSSFGGMDGFERREDKQLDLKDTDVRRSDPEVPSSSSSSSLSEDESRAVKLRSKQQRPPWRYWSRTGPEPQHRQPGGKHRQLKPHASLKHSYTKRSTFKHSNPTCIGMFLC